MTSMPTMNRVCIFDGFHSHEHSLYLHTTKRTHAHNKFTEVEKKKKKNAQFSTQTVTDLQKTTAYI